MCGSMVDFQSALRIGEEKKKKETTAAKYNDLSYWAAIIISQVTINDIPMAQKPPSW